ncbi:MAG: hypothetical protein O2894_12815 [Planctomycetota bacterium]|nr:hypothetical protein [Planctomycetota bacterium]
MILAAALLDVLSTVVGVVLALTGLALGFMGLSGIIEGTAKRGAVGLLIGLALLAGGLKLTGFL